MGSSKVRTLVLVRPPADDMSGCIQDTKVREPISTERYRKEWRRFVGALLRTGFEIAQLPKIPHPDGVFVQDLFFSERDPWTKEPFLIKMRLKEESRRPEMESAALWAAEHYRGQVWEITEGCAEGGDLISWGKFVFVGVANGGRTCERGLRQLRAILEGHYGFEVVPVPLRRGCLHLTTGCTFVGPAMVLLNPNWVDEGAFRRAGMNVLSIPRPDKEPWSANCIIAPSPDGRHHLIMGAGNPHTQILLQARFGSDAIIAVPLSQANRAQGSATCHHARIQMAA